MFPQFPFQYSFFKHLIPFHFQKTLYFHFDYIPFATRKLQKKRVKMEEKLETSIFLAKIVGSIFYYINYVMKVKSKHLQKLQL
jgi:hypothetical protein